MSIFGPLIKDQRSGTPRSDLCSPNKNIKKKIKDHEKWHLKNGLGMGVTLNMASEMDAYTLTDRGTWLSFNNKKY